MVKPVLVDGLYRFSSVAGCKLTRSLAAGIYLSPAITIYRPRQHDNRRIGLGI